MKTKPISPTGHALGDYAFALAALSVPALFGANKKTVRLYQLIALEVFLYGTLTKHKFALKPLIPLNTHLKIDLVNLAFLALLTGYKPIQKDRNIFKFNLALLGVGIVNVLLTDWDSKQV